MSDTSTSAPEPEEHGAEDQDLPGVSERVLSTKPRIERSTGGFADRHPKQARYLLYFEAAVFGALAIYALMPPMWGGFIILALFVLPFYVGLARLSLRQAWQGFWPPAFVVLGTLWVADSHYDLIRWEKVPLATDGVTAAMAMPIVGFYWFFALFGWPILTYAILRLLLPKP